jgi:hypothetical protein
MFKNSKIFYLSLFFILSSCNKNVKITELEGWETNNYEILESKLENISIDYFAGNSLFFQIDNASVLEKRKINLRINEFLKKENYERRIAELLKKRKENGNDREIYCWFYKDKFFGSYCYDGYQSDEFDDSGRFMDEDQNLIAFVIYEIKKENILMTIHTY